MTPRVGIAGPLLGGNTGWVTSQGEVLAARLGGDGWTVQTTSAITGRIRRALDTSLTMRRWSGDVDVVVVLVFSGPAFAMAELAARRTRHLGVPLVLWLHGGDLPRFARRSGRRVDRLLAQATQIVAPTAYLAELTDRPVEVLPNVIPDPPPIVAARSQVAPTLLWMRTYHDLYRPELAVEVAEQLRERLPEVRLTMAGQDKGTQAAVEALVRERDLGDRVRVTGFLDPAAKFQAFTDHDVFLNTSRVDNAPVSLIEAAAHGLPVVSTAVGGIPALFPDGERALLADDAGGLSDAVVRLVEDPELAARLSMAGITHAAAWTWAGVGPRWHALLTEAAGDA